MDKRLSNKFRILSLLSMIMVVVIHANNLSVKFDKQNIISERGFSFYIEKFLSDGLCRIAVPMFFMFSGYLFFINYENSLKGIRKKYVSRFKSLVIPYLLWSLWGLLLYFILQSIPFSAPFFTKERILDYSLTKWVYTIFVDPIPYQLWFLRDLILLVALSPLVYFLSSRIGFFYISALFLFWILRVDWPYPSVESILFFSLGCFFALQKININTKRINETLLLVLWITLVLIRTALFSFFLPGDYILYLLLKISIICGLVSVWIFYDKIKLSQTLFNKFLYLSSFGFFIYVFHEPLLTIVTKALYFLSGNTNQYQLLIYFLSPIIVIITSILVGKLIRRISGRFYKFLIGGRG